MAQDLDVLDERARCYVDLAARVSVLERIVTQLDGLSVDKRLGVMEAQLKIVLGLLGITATAALAVLFKLFLGG